MFKAHIFDCDGVLLRSNRAKTRAFYATALPYGKAAAEAMAELHRAAGNASRRERWERFVAEILKREECDGEVDRLVARCTELVRSGVRGIEEMPGARDYVEQCERAVCVSGIEALELWKVLQAHRFDRSFEGVYGGPRRKSEILKWLVSSGAIEQPAVYYGDTEDDYKAASAAGLAFVFVHGDTEWAGWREFFAERPEVAVIEDFSRAVRGPGEETGTGWANTSQPACATTNPPRPAHGRMKGQRVVVDEGGYVMREGERWFIGRELAGLEVRLR